MGVFGGPNVSEDGLVLALDGANFKSFKGEVTTNLSRNSRDFSGTAYASSDEWVSSEPTRLTKTYISSIVTPIGNGATLIQESGNNGYHHLSRWGGGDESGAHSLSCYVFPLTSDITDFVIGMLADGNNQISFNLNTGAITYGPGISNRDAFITPVVGFDGWYRVGANIEGRYGGWVGSIGYTTSAAYTGTSGNKKCYITGIQYESKSSPTSFVEAQTTRGTTVATGGGWADLTGNGNNGELVNGVRESSANGGSLYFEGSDDYVNCGSPSTLNFGTGNFNLSCWVNIPSTSGADWIGIISRYVSGVGFWIQLNPGNRYVGFGWDGSNYITSSSSAGGGQWKFISCQRTGSTSAEVYVNGISVASSSSMSSGTSNGQQIDIGRIDIAGRYSAGNIAQVSIYNRALTAAEISQNFNALRGRFGI